MSTFLTKRSAGNHCHHWHQLRDKVASTPSAGSKKKSLSFAQVSRHRHCHQKASKRKESPISRSIPPFWTQTGCKKSVQKSRIDERVILQFYISRYCTDTPRNTSKSWKTKRVLPCRQSVATATNRASVHRPAFIPSLEMRPISGRSPTKKKSLAWRWPQPSPHQPKPLPQLVTSALHVLLKCSRWKSKQLLHRTVLQQLRENLLSAQHQHTNTAGREATHKTNSPIREAAGNAFAAHQTQIKDCLA